MVAFLACSGPNSLLTNVNYTPEWNQCAGSDSKPCPLCGTLCLNPRIQETPGHCENLGCKCCFKSSNAGAVENTEYCKCCGKQVTNINASYSTQGHPCQCYEEGLKNKNLTENRQKNYGFDHRMLNQIHNSFCPCYTDDYSRYYSNNQCPMNMPSCCHNCWGFPCNINPPNSGCCCQQLPNNSAKHKIGLTDKMVECKPEKPLMVIGGKLYNCFCAKRNGLQDECLI